MDITPVFKSTNFDNALFIWLPLGIIIIFVSRIAFILMPVDVLGVRPIRFYGSFATGRIIPRLITHVECPSRRQEQTDQNRKIQQVYGTEYCPLFDGIRWVRIIKFPICFAFVFLNEVTLFAQFTWKVWIINLHSTFFVSFPSIRGTCWNYAIALHWPINKLNNHTCRTCLLRQKWRYSKAPNKQVTDFKFSWKIQFLIFSFNSDVSVWKHVQFTIEQNIHLLNSFANCNVNGLITANGEFHDGNVFE